MHKLAIVVSHPIQYYAPWFRCIAHTAGMDLKVFYLWDFGVHRKVDPGFGQELEWDVPLLEGYDHEFVPNISPRPGTRNFFGLDNPFLIKKVEDFHPDAILLMNYNYFGLYRFMLSWRKSPLLFRGDSHRLVKGSRLIDSLKRMWVSLVMKRFAAVLYVGSANREYYRYHGVPEGRMFFSPHAVDNQRFFGAGKAAESAATAWKEELGIPAGDKVVLFSGKFVAKKRPIDVLEAFKLAEVPGASLLFVGSGELEHDLKKYAVGTPKVFFAPFQNQSRMPVVYASCDVFVLPSCGRDETWGLSVNEAMCMSKAVIVSDHVGCARDLVLAGENGLIFKAGDIGGLADCLRHALADPGRLRAWGGKSSEIIRRYSYKEATEGLIRALSFVLSERR